ncbi:MAG: hypothetical protein H8E98_06180 [Bacteroidetes bacterium]|nr:hypothetical protein [Bacteroidota bacterium]
MSEIKQKIRDMIKEEIENFKSIKEATTEKIDGIIVVTNPNGSVELHLPQGMKGAELKKWLAKHPDVDKKWAKK